MKILFLHNYFHVESGSGRCMFQEASMLEEQGHEVHFFTTDKAPYWDEAYPYTDHFPRYIDYPSLTFPGKIRHAFRPFRNPDAEGRLDRLLAILKPDIVHEHTTSFQLTPAVLRACYRHAVPVVLTLHGPGFFCPAQGLMRGGKRHCREESCIRGNFLPCLLQGCLNSGVARDLMTAMIYSYYHRMGFYRGVSTFICASRAMFDLALRAGLAAEKLSLVPYGLDRSWSDIRPEYGTGDYFLFAGRLDKAKGAHFLLEAMSRLPPTVRLRIAGRGPEENGLRNRADALGLANVDFIGWKEGPELADLYRGAIATVLPCNWFEAFGLTIVESFFHGKPVIASSVGGIPEVIEDGADGLLVEPGDVESLAAAMARLVADRAMTAGMGRQGRAKAESRYGAGAHCESLMRVYAAVVKSRRRA